MPNEMRLNSNSAPPIAIMARSQVDRGIFLGLGREETFNYRGGTVTRCGATREHDENAMRQQQNMRPKLDDFPKAERKGSAWRCREKAKTLMQRHGARA